jgi:hypothetical protein
MFFMTNLQELAFSRGGSMVERRGLFKEKPARLNLTWDDGTVSPEQAVDFLERHLQGSGPSLGGEGGRSSGRLPHAHAGRLHPQSLRTLSRMVLRPVRLALVTVRE